MSTLLRNGTSVEDPRLGRLAPVDWRHVEKYPLTLTTIPEKPQPMVGGFNWYEGCDRPVIRKVKSWNYWMILAESLGRLRGGHAVPLFSWQTYPDIAGWWRYYNQGQEGRCVEFAWLRNRSLFNRKRYDITSRWHYYEMQKRDYWPGGSYPGATPQYEGTSVDAGAQVMAQFGAIPMGGSAPVLSEGISRYRWATSWDDVRKTTGTPDWLPGVQMGNNWGEDYPGRVLIEDAAGERFLQEDGEFCVVTDR